jgi:predicted  nucleic acid-binding Zn-ribbon protein
MEALKERDDVSSWNDDRLDELATDVKAGFAKVDARFEKVEGEMKAGFAKVDGRFEKVDKRFEKVDKRFEKLDQKIDEKFERLYHVLIAGMVVIVGALVGVPAIGG